MSNVIDIYKALAVRINYPIEPTHRCIQKIIGYLNLLLSLTNTPQYVVEVKLDGKPGKRFYNKNNEKIAYMLDGSPAVMNPDGTINTKDSTAFVIRSGLFQDNDTGFQKNFVTSEKDVLTDNYYLQPILTALYLVLSGVSPSEAVMYINDACTRSTAKVHTQQVNLNNIKRRL